MKLRGETPAERAGGVVFWVLLCAGAVAWAVLIFGGRPGLGALIGITAFLCAVMIHFIVVARTERARERADDEVD